MIDRRLLKHVVEIIKACDGQCTPEQQQEISETKAYLAGLRTKQFSCWSCNLSRSQLQGISLDDTDEVHVCDSCWAKIPHYWRLMAKKWFMDNPGPRSDVVHQLIQEAIKPRRN